ncbi:unnamed protein product [Rotaria sp. Silwood1]|nr:unnamed protein product [Rotaria sp. Silwood1]
MIIGIMSIMMSGAVYAPINPNDPLNRLESLIHQTDAKVVLVNHLSRSHISQLNLPIVNISEIFLSDNVVSDAQMKELSEVVVTPESISHIVFTSGSTGTPKAVQIRHRNFMGYMNAHFIETNDVILQLASSSFDVHLDEINGALVKGAHLVLLKVGGHLDFDYVTKVIHQKNVTFVAPVPSWMNALGKFLGENRHAQERIKQVRLWYLGGEQLFSSTVRQFLPFISEQCHILNSYGPAEITEAATFYEVRREELSRITSLPIGRPMTGYRVYLLDEYRQQVIPGQMGEIFIGGVGVFAGYYGRADLSSQVLIDIDGEQCYATGDLARLDCKSGELVFIGRRDFQVKIRGQRIELGEIEENIMKGSRDLIVGTVEANRYRPELQQIIGMFVNTLPMRLQVDPQDTFEQLLRRVSNMMCEVQPHSSLPYQYIIQQISMGRAHQGNLIRTMFTLDEVDTTLVRLDYGLMIESWPLSSLKSNSMQIGTPKIAAAMFDMTLSLEYRVDKHSLRAEMIVSRDLFDSVTLVKMARQFQFTVEKLFSPMPMTMMIIEQSISDLSLILPEEIADDMQHAQFPAITGINSIDNVVSDAQMKELSEVVVTPESISHIVFTSGSTGTPKAVQIRHRNFMGYMNAHFIETNDVILQLASSSFDVHLDEINGALVKGAHLVLLKVGGHLDFDYVTKVIHQKNVTFVAPVPSWMNALGKFLGENRHAQERIKQVRLWYLGGEQLFSSTVRQFLPFISEQCHILNSYGPAEITEAATFYEVRREELSRITSLPIGRPMTGYRVYLLDEYRQQVIPGQMGEIFIGGVGVFAGYYGRADLSSQVLIDIDGEQCYATGDLARLDCKSGELVFIGRRDFQVKIRGQRIELSAIELVIIESSPSIINCVVVKENLEDDNYLVAYIQVKEHYEKKQLENEINLACRNHLSSYMIPSKWLFVPKLPLNANGKIDRNALGTIATEAVDLLNEHQTTKVLSSLERKLQDIFFRAFHLKSIPDVETTFGQLGGTSLGAMRALNIIRQEVFERMDIALLFGNPSVRELAAVLESILSNVEPDRQKQEEDLDFSIRLRSSWLIETIGIFLLTWQWLWPIFVAARLNFLLVQVTADDGFRFVSETAHRYDIIFIDAFVEEAMPTHMNTAQFFLNLSGILNSDGCLATNANLPTTNAFDRLTQTCCSTFESNVLFAHTNIIENARVIISGTLSCLKPITSQVHAIHAAEELESDAMLEFSLSRLIALAYRGLLIDKDKRT